MQEKLSDENNEAKVFNLDSNRRLKLTAFKKKHLALSLLILLIVVIALFLNSNSEPKTFNQEVFNKHVTSYMNSGNYKGLISYINTLPKNQQTYSTLISVYTTENNNQAALNIYKTMINKYGDNESLASGAAATAQAAQQYSLALNYYRQSLQYEKNLPVYPMQEANEQFYAAKIKSLESIH